LLGCFYATGANTHIGLSASVNLKPIAIVNVREVISNSEGNSNEKHSFTSSWLAAVSGLILVVTALSFLIHGFVPDDIAGTVLALNKCFKVGVLK
jgi:hypothetical protein